MKMNYYTPTVSYIEFAPGGVLCGSKDGYNGTNDPEPGSGTPKNAPGRVF